MSEDGAAAPQREPAPLPWEGKAERTDIFLVAAIAISGIYKLALIPLTPTWVNSHPVWLEILKGSISGMVIMGAKARIGEASLLVAVLAAVPGLMMFNWIYWWAGRRWGKRALDFFLGNHPKAEVRTARLERLFHRFGWIAVVIAWFQPIPNALIYAAAGWTRMRLVTFVFLDLIGLAVVDRVLRRARVRDRAERGGRRQGGGPLRAVRHDRADRRRLRPPVLRGEPQAGLGERRAQPRA